MRRWRDWMWQTWRSVLLLLSCPKYKMSRHLSDKFKVFNLLIDKDSFAAKVVALLFLFSLCWSTPSVVLWKTLSWSSSIPAPSLVMVVSRPRWTSTPSWDRSRSTRRRLQLLPPLLRLPRPLKLANYDCLFLTLEINKPLSRIIIVESLFS